MPQRRTDLPLILASDTGLPEQFKPWLMLFPKSKAFFRNQLQKLILEAFASFCPLVEAVATTGAADKNQGCGGD
jgi:hypothetical protein